MQKISFDDFKEALQNVTSSLSDDDKLEFYEELLDTGSACITNANTEHNFSIHDGFVYEAITFDSTLNDDDILNFRELEDDIDYIIGMDDNNQDGE